MRIKFRHKNSIEDWLWMNGIRSCTRGEKEARYFDKCELDAALCILKEAGFNNWAEIIVVHQRYSL
jgi:hypothetical protein